MPNERQFPLSTVCSILNMAISTTIKFDLPGIFRESVHTKSRHYLKLKYKVLKLSEEESLSDKKIEEFTLKRNRKATKKKEKERRKHGSDIKNNDEIAREEEKALPINSYVWSVLVKQAMQNGCILDKKNPAVKVAKRLLASELIACISLLPIAEPQSPVRKEKGVDFLASSSHSVAFKPLPPTPVIHARRVQEVQNILLNFIGQLCKPETNQLASAEAIHNFLHIGRRIIDLQRKRGVDEDALAQNFGGVLRDALELSGKVYVTPPSTPTKETLTGDAAIIESADMITNEVKLFSRFTAHWLALPIFSRPFDPKLYADYRQNSAIYSSELNAMLGIKKVLANVSVPLAQIDAKLSSSSSSEITPAYSQNGNGHGGSIQLTPILGKEGNGKKQQGSTIKDKVTGEKLLKKFASVLNLNQALDPLPSPNRSKPHGSEHKHRSGHANGSHLDPSATVLRQKKPREKTPNVPMQFVPTSEPVQLVEKGSAQGDRRDAAPGPVLCYLAVIPRNIADGKPCTISLNGSHISDVSSTSETKRNGVVPKPGPNSF